MLRGLALKQILNLFPYEKRENALRIVMASVGIGETTLTREASHFAQLLGHKNTSPLILDVGANSGLWSKELSSLLRDVRIHMFEPSVNLHDILEHLANTSHPNLTIHRYGLSGDGRECFLYSPSLASGAASIIESENLDYKFREVIQTKTLESVLIALPDCLGIKFDIEGAELEVLTSGYDAIKKSKVKVIQFEFGEKTTLLNQNFWQFYNLFSSLNFELFRSTPTGLHNIREYSRFQEIHINTVYFAARTKEYH